MKPCPAAIAGLLLLPLLLLAAWPSPAAAESTAVKRLQESIREQKKEAQSAKQAIDRLSDKERELFTDLAELEDKVIRLEDEVWEAEARLEEVQGTQRKILARSDKLETRRRAVARDLGGLLASLWPIHLDNRVSKLRGLSTWEKADRRFTWLSALYREGGRALAELARVSSELAASLAEQDRLENEISRQMEQLREKKDQALEAKLRLVHSIQKIRAEKISREEELDRVLATVESLRYKLKTLTTKKISKLKGSLPWPADGPVVAKFAPGAEPPVRGLGLSLSSGDRVRAVSWGKVVHNDVLRGFGQVVIVYHGEKYYTLYAFLSQSFVRMGQEVEKDEPLGAAGYYPAAEGPGLYFELRFRQNALNPVSWLRPNR